MTLYSKVARRLFMVFVVIVCGGWYSGNRAISQINEKQLADDLLINTPIARAADAAVLSERQLQGEEFNKHKKRQKEKILVFAENKGEKRISKRARKIIEQSRKLNKNSIMERPRGSGLRKGARSCVNEDGGDEKRCYEMSYSGDDNPCREAPKDPTTGLPHCFGGSTMVRFYVICECADNTDPSKTWKEQRYMCCDNDGAQPANTQFE